MSFYNNFHSRLGLNLTARPVAALVFLPALDQVFRAIICQPASQSLSFFL